MIVAFHNPLDALSAAMEAQQALLAADWPADLLAHPLCIPQYGQVGAPSALVLSMLLRMFAHIQCLSCVRLHRQIGDPAIQSLECLQLLMSATVTVGFACM
jgi:hypothetical protein